MSTRIFQHLHLSPVRPSNCQLTNAPIIDSVGMALKVALPKHHKIQNGTAHGLRTATGRENEVTQQQVAFEARNGGVPCPPLPNVEP